MTNLDAGILNKRITIQEFTEEHDSEGGYTEEWSDVGTYWASVRPLSAKQIFEYSSLNVKASHRIKVRAAVPVVEGNRISFDSRYFEVLTVENEMEANVVKWVTCQEVRN